MSFKVSETISHRLTGMDSWFSMYNIFTKLFIHFKNYFLIILVFFFEIACWSNAKHYNNNNESLQQLEIQTSILKK